MPDATKFLIWSLEHRAWWAPGRQGYVFNHVDAGRYTFDEAAEITVGHIPPGEEIAVPDHAHILGYEQQRLELMFDILQREDPMRHPRTNVHPDVVGFDLVELHGHEQALVIARKMQITDYYYYWREVEREVPALVRQRGATV